MKPLALVLERDANTRKLLDVLLTRFGYDVDRIGVTADALTLLELIDYDFVLSDDEKIAGWLSNHRAETLPRMMILSSAIESQLARMRSEWSEVRVIRKPFELADVIDASRAAANRPRRTPRFGEAFWRTSAMTGAKSGILLRLGGHSADVVTSYGYEPGSLDRFFPLSIHDPYPICAAMRHGRPIWMASLTESHDYPLLAAVWQQNHTRALAAVPIMRGSEVIGAAGWTFRDTQRFSEAEQRAWLGVAEVVTALVEGDSSAQPSSQTGA